MPAARHGGMMNDRYVSRRLARARNWLAASGTGGPSYPEGGLYDSSRISTLGLTTPRSLQLTCI